MSRHSCVRRLLASGLGVRIWQDSAPPRVLITRKRPRPAFRRASVHRSGGWLLRRLGGGTRAASLAALVGFGLDIRLWRGCLGPIHPLRGRAAGARGKDALEERL